MQKPIDCYAVFGNPIQHSKSPMLQTAFAQQTQQAISYTAECIDVNNFSTAANLFFAKGGCGLNVTVPFKLDAFHYADTLTDRAKKAGAVNTLIRKEQTIIGDNTDGIGLLNDISKNLQWPITQQRILILGAGGAVRGILEPLLHACPSQILIANRTFEKAHLLAEAFATEGNISACSYDALLSEKQPFDLIINGTSASLHGQLPSLPDHIVDSHTACYDMMYGKENTLFMQWGKENGAKNIADGLGMLVCQGAESFFLWRGVYPETQRVIQSIRDSL